MINNEYIKSLLDEAKPIFEPNVLEFKKAEDLSGSFLESISSFANSDGGDILLGIHQCSVQPLRYVGIEGAESQESKIRDILRNKLVNLMESDYKISIENFDGKELPIIKIRIEKVIDVNRRPVYILERGIEKGSFIRIGQRDEHMPAYLIEEIKKEQLILSKKIPISELQILEGTSIDDVDMDLVREFAEKTNQGLSVLDSKNDFNNFLITKGALSDGKLTKFGLLCFCVNPERILGYQASIHVSDETQVNVLEGKTGEGKNIFEGNLKRVIEDVMAWLKRNLKKERIIDESGLAKEESVISLRILREIIANSLCHRDYDANEKVYVKILGNSVIVVNPGILKNKIYNAGWIFPGKAIHQNPSIAKYLFRISQAEGEGKGFTLLIKSCLAQRIDIPIVEIDFSGRVSVMVSSNKLMSEEIDIWLENKKYAFSVRLNEVDKCILAYLYKSHRLIRDGKFVMNLTAECLEESQRESLEKLKENNLIVEDYIESTKIYRLNEELLREDFSSELLELYGDDYLEIDREGKKILNYAIQLDKLKQEFSAKKIASHLYFNDREEKLEDNTVRRVRYKCNDLCKKGFLYRNKEIYVASLGGNLRINKKYLAQKEKTKSVEVVPDKPGVQEKLF